MLHNLRKAIHHAVVFVCLRSVLETDLDELEGHYDEGLGCTSSGSGKDRERLVHLLLAEEVAVESAPRVICGKLGGPVCFSDGAVAGVADIATSWAPP